MDPVAMTFAAVGWLMSTLVNKAVTALLEAWAKRIGLGNEFETLKDQLLQLGALLISYRGLRTNSSCLEELVENLQQLAYQAENLLDELDYYRLEDEIQHRGTQEKVNCSHKSSIATSSSGFRLASRSILSTLKGMTCCSAQDAQISLPETFSSRINLPRRMNELAEQLQKSGEKVRNAVQTESQVITAWNTEINQSEATNLHQTSSFLTEPRVFGRDYERDQLMNLLTNEETAIVGNVPVLAIVGSGGVGKTTLAGLVFNDPKVQSCFDVRSWICVSTPFDIVRLTREMLEGACSNRYGELRNLNELQTKLKDKLESKRFLLVLDDMWEYEDKSQWDSLVALLNNCMVKRGIILVTTRNQSVAKMVDARHNIYLQGLEDNEFLSFFSTCIFNDPNFGGNWRLRNIGQQIANKLKGNPLAAKTVSALLKKKLDERYWMEIRDSEEWKSQSGPNDIMPALRLSYDHMPFHLQRCFSYCAIFPEDRRFTCEEWVYLWMAQGFLDVRSEGKRMEDIGSAYFNDLFNRGFFQITKQLTDYGLAQYTFHDLIHDLACTVAFKECLSINGNEPRQIPATIRHLSIFISTEMGEDAIVRTLASLEGNNLSTIIHSDKFSSGIFRNMLDLLKGTKYLRAVSLTLFPEVQPHKFNFQNFVSLRYLRLRFRHDETTLPKEIWKLYHLEVFEIQVDKQFRELPNNFSDLVSLRHFIVHGYIDLHSKIWGVGKLTSLQELNQFHVQHKIGFEIEQLGSLKEIGGSLCIRNLENVKSKTEASKARLAEKKKLDALYLQWNHGEQENQSVLEGLKPNTNLKKLVIIGYGGVASPTWLEPSLIFLESLTLENCKALEQLPPIGELEFLKHLKLSGLTVREIGPQCYGTRQSMKFPSLEQLEIVDMPYLEKWVWNDQLQLFPCLKILKIQECKKLVELLPPIGELEFLKDLTLSGLPLREIGPQFYGTCQSMIFPSLEELSIIDMPDLEKWVWNDQLQQSVCFKKLKKLIVEKCTKLVDLPLPGCATSEVIERFPSLKSLIIEDCPLIFQLPPLPYSSVLSFISIARTGFIKSMYYSKGMQELSLSLNHSLSLEVGELLAFHEHSSLRSLEISNISSLESLDLHSFVALENLVIKRCQSLTSLTFGEHLVRLKTLEIRSCKTLSSMKGLKSWINLQRLYFHESPGFIAAWDSALKEIQRTEPDFSLSLKELKGDSFALLTLPICKQLTSLQYFHLELATFTEKHEISSLESLDLHSFVALENLVIRGCQSLTSLTFGEHLVCLRSLKIESCETLRSIKGLKSCVNLKELHFRESPGFIAAWDSASKEIQRTEPDFSLSLKEIYSDSLALLTLPICKQLTSLKHFELEFSDFIEEHEVSLQFLTSLDLVDIRGCKNLQSFPFDLFPSLKSLRIKFPRIQELSTNSRTEITEECKKLRKKLRNIKRVSIDDFPLEICFKLRAQRK